MPSTISYTAAPGQTSATVSFRLVAAPFACSVEPGGVGLQQPELAYGLLNFAIEPLSVVPSSLGVVAGATSASLRRRSATTTSS